MINSDKIIYKEAKERLKNVIRDVCKEYKVSESLLEELIEYESDKVHLERRRGAKKIIREKIENHLED